MTWQRNVSAVAVGVLGVALLVADVAVLAALTRGTGDPGGLLAILGVLALACVLPPTAFAVAGLLGLVRGRRNGFAWALAAHSWVAIGALLFLWANDGQSPWEFVVPGVLVVFGVSAALVAAVGWRDGGRAGSSAA